jgi:hypothetical protein
MIVLARRPPIAYAGDDAHVVLEEEADSLRRQRSSLK